MLFSVCNVAQSLILKERVTVVVSSRVFISSQSVTYLVSLATTMSRCGTQLYLAETAYDTIQPEWHSM